MIEDIRQPSTLYLPIRLDHHDLQQLVNQSITNLSLSQISQSSGRLSWALALRDDVRVDLDGQAITSVLPLDVTVEQDLGLTTVKGKGSIEVTLQTLFHIREDWTVQTFSTLAGHRWLVKPVAAVAGVKLPITTLTDWILESNRGELTQMIDEQIQKAFDLRALLTPLWTTLHRPRRIGDTIPLWFSFTPEQAGLEPFTMEEGVLHSGVHITGWTRLQAGGETPPEVLPLEDPRYTVAAENRHDSLRLVVRTEIPYSAAEAVAESNLIGQTLKSGNREVTVEGIEIYGQKDYLIASVRLRGSYNGQVHLRGRPLLNSEKNQVEIAGLDFDVQTRNVLHRSAAWLFKGNIRQTLEQQLTFPIEANLRQMQMEINRQLRDYRLGPWIRVESGGLAVGLEEVHLQPEGMVLNFLMTGQVMVHVAILN